MRRRDFLVVGSVLVGAPQFARSQSVQTKRLAMVSPSTNVTEMKVGQDNFFGWLLLEMKAVGFIEGENLIVDRYSGNGDQEKYAFAAFNRTKQCLVKQTKP